MKLRTKIIVLLLLPLLLILALVGGWNLQRWHTQMLDKDLRGMRQELEKVAQLIDRGNLEAVTATRMIATSQETGLFGKRAESVHFLRGVLEKFPQFIGVSIGYEPDADGQDAIYLEEYAGAPPAWMGEGGRFIPYWFRDQDDHQQLLLETLVRMDESLYYQGVKEAWQRDPDLRYLITEPYVYNNLNLIVEQMAPIIIRGRFAGITGVDRSLDFIHRLLVNSRPFATAEFYLISSRGRIIAATVDEQLRTLHIDDFYIGRDAAGNHSVLTEILDFDVSGDGVYQMNPHRRKRLLEADIDRSYQDWFRRFLIARSGTEPVVFYDPLRNADAFIAASPVVTGNWRLVMTVSRAEILAPIRATVWQFLLVGLFGTLAVGLCLYLFAGGIVRRILQANEVAQKIAAGDLSSEIETTCRDETGQLLLAIRSMVENLNHLIFQVKQASIQLVSTATRITSSAKTQESTIQDFGSSTTQIATAVREISSTSGELLQTMEEVSASGNETSSMAEGGRRQLAEMANSMDSLASATNNVSARLAVIADKANNINKVVETINRVSGQTNLLSLNAAIEAEKAGEYGAGFAVVAREIRRLARQTAQATVDIEDMVKDMQTAVHSGVMEMDKFSQEVRNDAGEIHSLGKQLETIIDRVQQLGPRFESVKEGMRAQTQGAGQISDAMTTLKEGARKSADSLREFDKVSTALHQAVNGLRKEVSRFKVAEHNITGHTRMPFALPSDGNVKKAPSGHSDKATPQT